MVREVLDSIVIGAGGGHPDPLAMHAGGKELDCTLDQLGLNVLRSGRPDHAQNGNGGGEERGRGNHCQRSSCRG